MFIIFINAIGALKLKGKLFLFADDAVLLHIHESKTSIETSIQDDMKIVREFFNQRKLILNAEKTFFMLFFSVYKKIEYPFKIVLDPSTVLKRVTSTSHLGLLFDENLRWADHINKLEKKVASTNGIIWKLRKILPLHAKKLIYDTLLQSHLGYMSTLWGLASCKALRNIQVLQNRALRNVYDLPNRCNRVDMYTHRVENHLPIRGFSLLNIAKFMYASTKNITHSNISFTKSTTVHSRALRSNLNESLRPEKANTIYGEKSIETIGPKIYSKIPTAIRHSKHQHAFKWVLKCHLRNESFIKSCFDKTFFELHIDNNQIQHLSSSQSTQQSKCRY
jgi:hypothetical protein